MAKPARIDNYRLGYRWTIEGPIETVFRYVSDARTYPEWFFVFKEVHPDDPAAPLRVGSHSVCRVKALLPYVLDWDLTVAQFEPPRLIQIDCRLTLGERFRMNGYVRYRFEQNGPLVSVINEQELAADRPLPRLLHPVARAVFTLNHDWAMERAQAPLQAVVQRASAAGRPAPAPAER